jgi:hypothetical protein
MITPSIVKPPKKDISHYSTQKRQNQDFLQKRFATPLTLPSLAHIMLRKTFGKGDRISGG